MQKRSARTGVVGGTILSVILVLAISLFFIPVHTGNLSVFADDANYANGGKWSPDGHWLAASIFPGDTVRLFSPDGQVRSTWQSGCDLGGSGTNFSWVSDGRISCFTGNVPPVLQIIELDQKGQIKGRTLISVPITPGTIVYDVQWNPRRFWLATIAEAQPGGGARSETLYLSDLDGHSLISPLRISGEQLAWSPDGTILALVQENGDIVLLKVQQTKSGKLAMTRIRQLAAGTPNDENVAWSPSGRWLVCRHGTYESEDYLFLLATDGSGKRVKLTSSYTDGQLALPAWSPDGKQLIVSTVFIFNNRLMSLNMSEILNEKGISGRDI